MTYYYIKFTSLYCRGRYLLNLSTAHHRFQIMMRQRIEPNLAAMIEEGKFCLTFSQREIIASCRYCPNFWNKWILWTWNDCILLVYVDEQTRRIIWYTLVVLTSSSNKEYHVITKNEIYLMPCFLEKKLQWIDSVQVQKIELNAPRVKIL